MNLTSLTYTRSAKVTDSQNRYENHDISLTATIQGEWDDETKDDAYQSLKEWVLGKVRDEVREIRDTP